MISRHLEDRRTQSAIGLAIASAAQRLDVEPMPLTRGGQMDLARELALGVVRHAATVDPNMTVRELEERLARRRAGETPPPRPRFVLVIARLMVETDHTTPIQSRVDIWAGSDAPSQSEIDDAATRARAIGWTGKSLELRDGRGDLLGLREPSEH